MKTTVALIDDHELLRSGLAAIINSLGEFEVVLEAGNGLEFIKKVKALNQADQSFFFLDEGFGALDKNSLRVVFETLKALRHENRVVGIISHVEELQQEVGVYAQVELDAEQGSSISYSF